MIYRKKRLFTYDYILKKRINEMKRELLKPENATVPIIILVKRIISNEKIVIPRLDVFERICASPCDHS